MIRAATGSRRWPLLAWWALLLFAGRSAVRGFASLQSAEVSR